MHVPRTDRLPEAGSPAPVTLGRTRTGGVRLRAGLVVTAGLLLVGAGVFGRLDAARSPAKPPASARVAVPSPAATLDVAGMLPMHGYVPYIGPQKPVAVTPPGYLPHVGPVPVPRIIEPLGSDGVMGGIPPFSGATSEIASDYLHAVVVFDATHLLHTRLDRDGAGVYQASIPLADPQETVMASLEVYPSFSPERSDLAALPTADDGTIIRAPVRIDARPFPPGSIPALVDRKAGSTVFFPIAQVLRTDFVLLATLVSDGTTVDLSIAFAPRLVASASPAPNRGRRCHFARMSPASPPNC